MNPEATPPHGTAGLQESLVRAGQWLPALVALLAMIGIILLIIRGETEQIMPVAMFGGAVFAGGTIVSVTVNIRR